jgi:hypothetical protein
MRELLGFYLFHRNGHVRRSRNGAAASIVFFIIFGYGFGAASLLAWALRGFGDLWALALASALILGATVLAQLLRPRAARVHQVLEKYRDPVIYENDLFTACDQDVSTALLYDAYGKTDLAITKLKVAVEVNPGNRPAQHLLRMIAERDEIAVGAAVAP